MQQIVSQPESVVHMVEDDVKTIASGGVGAYATKSWKEKAVKVDVMGYASNMELTNSELVSDSLVSVSSKASTLTKQDAKGTLITKRKGISCVCALQMFLHVSNP